MDKIRIQDIDKAVEEHKCPGRYFCTVATTGYDQHRRERICLQCWLDHMKENEVEVVYDGCR